MPNSIQNPTLNSKFPVDWPEAGPIDLTVHDLPHLTSTIEWWYQNAHLETTCGRNFSLFASFFRKLIKYDEATGEGEYGHSISWAIVDIEKEKYYNVSYIDRRAPEIGLEKLRKGELVEDSRLRKAAIEMLEKGNVPYPDRLLSDDPEVNYGELSLNFEGNTFRKNENDEYELHLHDDTHKVGCTLKFEPQTEAIRHGDNGVVEGKSFEDMFYYFIPKNIVTGTITIGEDTMEVKKGLGWYDHEFGCYKDPEDGVEERKGNLSKDASWNWLCLQLDNGYQLSCYDLYDNIIDEKCKGFLNLIDPEGNRTQISDFTFEPVGGMWTSMRTFADYPLDWKLIVPELDLDIDIKAQFGQQEFATVISKPAFWEGRVNGVGKFGETEVSGPGFIERSGFTTIESMEDFFRVVSRETIKSVRMILPKNPQGEKFNELVSKKDNSHYTEYIDSAQFSKSLIEPIREIIDRGGKSWRSYAALACCDIVGGNSQVVQDWLALPELMHVGSLIVDDVEDKSTIRRGKETVHLMYGEDVAINAGTACYFLGQICVYHADLDDKRKVEVYNLYFEALRAAHSGQALDIHGLDYMMDDIVENGGDLLINRSIAIHRLKSAVPASSLASMGATLGGGSPEQSKGLGDYFEALGIAFQIVDDSLNLKGFQDGLKSKGEDITAGKVTYPVAVAMSRLEKPQRKELWDIIKSKPEDRPTIGRAIELIASVDAVDGCLQEAKDMMEEAWRNLDPLVIDSMVKLNLRAFSWYVLDRQY